ncbi:MAG TPA: GNAT family N-acetyltransferase [Chloroflexia bacterium]|jgi:predicted GNAT family acetyltransferase
MQTRLLSPDDRGALEGLLLREPEHNLFHLSALVEYGLAPPGDPYNGAWAVGAFREGELAGVVMALRGTGGIYHSPGDLDTLDTLARTVRDRAAEGKISLLSGHETQVGALLPLISDASNNPADLCHFRTVRPDHLRLPTQADSPAYAARLATEDDMERLIDFYMVGFYSLARLPSRSAWRTRLSEQFAFRTLFMVEDSEGKVLSAALSSAEGGGSAMLGGVATLHEHRGKGLSTLCVGALCDHLFRKGLGSVSLFYLVENHTAGRVYEKLGFQDAGKWLLAPLGYAFNSFFRSEKLEARS